jgi:hypothetical protein
MKFLMALILSVIPIYALGYSLGYSLGFVGETEVHYHAGFVVYENGEKVDLSGLEYQTIEPCGESHDHSGMKTYEEAMVHLHDGVGDVVHVHAEGQTWRIFLESLGLDPVEYSQTYRNGVEASLMDEIIEPYERVVFADAVTPVTPELIESVPSRDRIVEVEGKSETCSK